MTRTRAQLLTGLAIIAVLAVGVVLAGLRFGMERERAAQSAVAGPEVTDGIVIEATVLSVDPAKNDMSVRIIPVPHGSYGQLAYEKPFTLITGTSNGLRETTIKVGAPVTAYDISTSMHDSQVTNYPFDLYHAELGFLLSSVSDSGSPERSAAIPLRVQIEGVLHGYKIEINPAVETTKLTTAPVENGEASVSNTTFTISRSGSTRFFAVFVMILMWAISLGILWIALSVLFRRRKIELAILSVMGIVLFALPNIRNAQPNAPPIGSLTDVLSFFWCESLVAACLVVMIVVFVRRTTPEDGEPPLKPVPENADGI